MSLGENINRLRIEKKMSQGDLAEALDVSRQSISKWETDGSVPELEKLMRLAELFGVSLDELVTGQSAEGEDSPKSDQLESRQVVVERQGMEGRKIAGIVLFCMAFAVVLLCTVMGGLLTGLVLCLPFLICGIICFAAKKHPGLWCAWALYLMTDGYLRFATGLNWSAVWLTLRWTPQMNYMRLIVAWCQFLCGLGLLAGTVIKLRKGPALEWTCRNKALLAAECVLFLLLCLPVSTWLFQAGGLSLANLATLISWLQDALRLALLARILTMLARRRKR